MKIHLTLKKCLLIVTLLSTVSKANDNHAIDINKVFINSPTVIKEKEYNNYITDIEVNTIIEDFLKGSFPITSVQGDGLWQAMNGGDIIGNGGGIGESFFQYALLELPTLINECLSSKFCDINDDEALILSRVAKVAKMNSQLDFALLFVNPKKEHTLFLQEDGLARSALTGREPLFPVIINLDHVYRDNNLSIDLMDAVRLLVHELGHQAGIENHSHLDKLGAKVQQFINLQSIVKNSVTDRNGNHYELWLKNSDTTELTSFAVYFSKNGVQQDLRDQFLDQVKCPEGLNVYDYKFQNIHWKQASNNNISQIGAWANVQCKEQNTDLVYEVLLDNLTIELE